MSSQFLQRQQSFPTERQASGPQMSQMVDTKKYFCPIFRRYGGCGRGKKCPFSHNNNSINVPKGYCIKFIKNRCNETAQSCRLRHAEPAPSREVATSGPEGAPQANKTPLQFRSSQLPQASQPRRQQPVVQTNRLPAPISSVTRKPPTLQAQYAELLIQQQQRQRPSQVSHAPTKSNDKRLESLRRHEYLMGGEPWTESTSDLYRRSSDKICGICLEIVVEKKPYLSSRFGLQENCNHVFCWSCLDGWRQQCSHGIICPECRVWGSAIMPAVYWIDHPSLIRELIREITLLEHHWTVEESDVHVDPVMYSPAQVYDPSRSLDIDRWPEHQLTLEDFGEDTAMSRLARIYDPDNHFFERSSAPSTNSRDSPDGGTSWTRISLILLTICGFSFWLTRA